MQLCNFGQTPFLIERDLPADRERDPRGAIAAQLAVATSGGADPADVAIALRLVLS
jgi:predicted PP-loop superfamily ATPase